MQPKVYKIMRILPGSGSEKHQNLSVVWLSEYRIHNSCRSAYTDKRKIAKCCEAKVHHAMSTSCRQGTICADGTVHSVNDDCDSHQEVVEIRYSP